MTPLVRYTARVSEARCYFTGDISRLKHYFHYESHIDKPRNWWQTTLESGRTVHTFSLVIRIHWLNQEYNYTEKPKSHSAPPTILRPICNNTSKNTETMRGFVELNISCLNIRRYLTLSDFHYQTHTTLNLKMCNKTDLIVKNSIFSKNNWRNIWIYQIKVVTLHHQNNNSNNN